MIKYITAAVMLLTITISQAQNNNRADTTILGIYSTGARFNLTRADFGQQTATEILTDMVMAYDTVQVSTSVTDTTRGGGRQKRSYEHRCNYLSGLLGTPDFFKDKIVLMEYNKDCDFTQVCFLAQKAGAKSFVFIHNSNSNGNIHLSKKGAFKDSITIPVFIVGKEKGADISALLPSKAGIKTILPPPLTRAVNDSTQTNVLVTKQEAHTEGVTSTTANSETANSSDLENNTAFGKQGFSVSPNPTRNQANVNYQFKAATDVTIEAKTATGQVIFSQILRGATSGSLNIPTTDWASGTYFVTLQYGKEVKTKQLVVRH